MNKFFCTFIFSCLILNVTSCFGDIAFDNEWYKAQGEYETISKIYDSRGYDKYLHSYWVQSRSEVKDLVTGISNKRFLQHPTINWGMVWGGSIDSNRFEGNYIKGFLSESTKKKILAFKDVDTSFLPHGYRDFDCSCNTLHHLFYAAKCLEAMGADCVKNIVEFGGGYGNLARIFKCLEPEATIFIIDLPEFVYLQAVFLRSTLPGVDVIIHDKTTKEFKKGSINLIPVYLLEDIDLPADLFVSTFALSETTSYIQKLVAEKKFFNPKVCYITGQLFGWGKLGFENHSIIHNSLNKYFKDVEIRPFHLDLGGDFKSYEATAKYIL